jgi:hypothetical protein
VNDEDEKMLEGIEAVIDDRPIKHECENCGDAGMAPLSKLPLGWKYISENDELVDSLDDLDRRTVIVCAVCFGLVTRVIKKWAPR